MRRAIVLVVIVLALVSQGAAPAAVRFLSAPAVVWELTPLELYVWVEPSGQNRLLVVAAVDTWCDGDLWGCAVSVSRVPLDGAHARAQHRFRWSGLPAGDMRLVALVLSAERERGRDSQPLTVLSRR